MLIYLDSSHLDQLERLAAQQPDAAEKFLQWWMQEGCELGLSLHHAQEIAQLADAESIRRRLRAVAMFPIIRCGYFLSRSVLKYEIQTQLVGLSLDKVPQYSALRADFFPLSTTRDFKQAVISVEERFKHMRLELSAGAKMENIFKRDMAEVREAMRQAGVSWNSRFVNTNTQEARETAKILMRRVLQAGGEQLREVSEQLVDNYFDLIEHGDSDRDAWESVYGIREYPITKHIPNQDLDDVKLFFLLAQEQARSVSRFLGQTPGKFEVLVPHLNPYNCPGFRLKLAVTRARQRAPKCAEAGDEVDSDHLMFAPYVDLAFVDKRTFEFLKQEARRVTLLLPPDANARLRLAPTLQKVREEIEKELRSR